MKGYGNTERKKKKEKKRKKENGKKSILNVAHTEEPPVPKWHITIFFPFRLPSPPRYLSTPFVTSVYDNP